MLGLPMLEGTNPASCFLRSAIGFESACYSRIWSEVWAARTLFTSHCIWIYAGKMLSAINSDHYSFSWLFVCLVILFPATTFDCGGSAFPAVTLHIFTNKSSLTFRYLPLIYLPVSFVMVFWTSVWGCSLETM